MASEVASMNLNSPLPTSRVPSLALGQRLVIAQNKSESPALPGLLVSIPAPTEAIRKRANDRRAVAAERARRSTFGAGI
jgi:hypothetical protein